MIFAIPAHHWTGLCLRTESDRPSEWPFIAWVIRRRVESPRYPDTYPEVVLQYRQFSAFNAYVLRSGLKRSETETFDQIAGKYPARQLLLAADVARSVILSIGEDSIIESDRPPFGPDVMHYYSPVSMVPAGSRPSWAPTAKRLFTPPGVDPRRFVFAEGVP